MFDRVSKVYARGNTVYGEAGIDWVNRVSYLKMPASTYLSRAKHLSLLRFENHTTSSKMGKCYGFTHFLRFRKKSRLNSQANDFITFEIKKSVSLVSPVSTVSFRWSTVEEDDRSARRFKAASGGPETDRGGGGYHQCLCWEASQTAVGELAGRSRRQGVVPSPGTWCPSEQNRNVL